MRKEQLDFGQAISNLKREPEAGEPVAAIIHALETILRGRGFILTYKLY